MTLGTHDFLKALNEENIDEIMNFIKHSRQKMVCHQFCNKDGNYAIHIIAKKGSVADLECYMNVHQAIKLHAKNLKNNKGQTAFHIALLNNNELMAEKLEQYQVDWLLEDNEGNTPLHIATMQGLTITVERFCRLGALRNQHIERSILPIFMRSAKFDIHAKNKVHQSAFRIASFSGNEALIAILKTYGGQDHYEEAKQCLYQNDTEGVLKLIQAYPYIAKDCDNDGNTLVHHVVLRKQQTAPQLLRKLVQSGADVNYLNDEQQMPIHLLSQLGDFSLLLEELLRLGANINGVNGNGLTTLHYAASQNNTQAIDLLISKGALIKQVSNEGFTALHIAALYHKVEAFKHLIERHGATFNAAAYPKARVFFPDSAPEDTSAITPLWIAFQTKDKALLEYIIQFKNRINKKEELKNFRSIQGDSLYHLFAELNAIDACALLSQIGLNPFEPNKQGISALHVCAQKGHEALLRQLITDQSRFRFNIEAKTKEGKTAWRLAHENNHQAICQFLESRGATQAPVQIPMRGPITFIRDQYKYTKELENTWGYNIANKISLGVPVGIALATTGPVGAIATGTKQVLTYCAPSMILSYGSNFYYWLKPKLHNHTHWTLESAVDGLSYLPGFGLNVYQRLDWYNNFSRRAVGMACSYGLATAASFCTDNKNIQGALYVAGRDAGFILVDAYHSYHASQNNPELLQQQTEESLIHTIEIWRSICGESAAEFISKSLPILHLRDALYLTVGEIEHNGVEFLKSITAYEQFKQSVQSGVDLLFQYDSYLHPPKTWIFNLINKLDEINHKKEQFEKDLEALTLQYAVPDSDYQKYALSYVNKLKYALKAQEVNSAEDEEIIARNNFNQTEKEYNQAQEQGEIPAVLQTKYDFAKSELEQSSVKLIAAKALAQEYQKSFQESWLQTPKGALENNLFTMQHDHLNAQLAVTNLQTQLEHLQKTQANTEQLVKIEEQIKEARATCIRTESALALADSAWQEVLSTFEKDYYGKREQARLAVSEKLIEESKEKTRSILTASDSFHDEEQQVFQNEVAVFNNQQEINELQSQYEYFDKRVSSIEHPGAFIVKSVVTEADQHTNDAHIFANFIVLRIAATGVMTVQEADDRFHGFISSRHGKGNKVDSISQELSKEWIKTCNELKANFQAQKIKVTSALNEKRASHQLLEKRLETSRADVEVKKNALFSLLPDENKAQFLQAETVSNEQKEAQFWQAEHSPAEINELLGYIGQPDAARYHARKVNLGFSPNFQNDYDAKTISQLFIEYKYLFLPAPSQPSLNDEINQMTTVLKTGGLTAGTLNQVRSNINKDIALGLLQSPAEVTVSTQSQLVIAKLQRGLNQQNLFDETNKPFQNSLQDMLQTQNQTGAVSMITECLETYSKTVSIEVHGVWQPKALPTPETMENTGSNKKHGIKKFMHQPVKKTKAIGQDILSHSATPNSAMIGGDSQGNLYGGINGQVVNFYNFAHSAPSQMHLELPKTPSMALPLNALRATPTIREQTQTHIPTLAQSNSSIPVKATVVPLASRVGQHEAVLPLNTFLPSLAANAATQRPPFLSVSANQTTVVPPRRIKNTAVKVVKRPSIPAHTTRSGKSYQSTGSQEASQPKIATENPAIVSVVPPPQPQSLLSKVGTKLLDVVIGKAEASPIVGAALPTSALAAPVGVSANRTEQFDEGFRAGWKEEQATRFPIQVEALGRLLGQNPDDAPTSTEGYTFPKFRVTSGKTETLVEQPQPDQRPSILPIGAGSNLLLTQGLYALYRKGKSQSNERRHQQSADVKYKDAPEYLPGFPEATPVKSKTRNHSGKLRDRWLDKDGKILEWDSKKGEVERYTRDGSHLGGFDPVTGEQISKRVKNRRVER